MSLSVSASPVWDLLDYSQETQEYELFVSVTSEMNDIAGFPIEFWSLSPCANNTLDPLYGENPNSQWIGPFTTKLLYEPSEEPEILNMFGFSSDDTITQMSLTKAVFSRDINGIEKPKVGDVIKTLWNNKTYEIVDVGAENKIFQGKKLIWDFICKPFRHSNQSISADNIIFNRPDEDLFPNDNFEFDTLELSAIGDNEYIEEESDKIDNNSVDSSYYGYDTLD